jgi:hypothetical protein
MEVTLVLTLIAILKLSVEVCSGALAGVATVQVIGATGGGFSTFLPCCSTRPASPCPIPFVSVPPAKALAPPTPRA